MDDRLLEVYELAARGEVEGARALLVSLEDVPPQGRAEMEAFLNSVASGGEVETVEAVGAGLAGPMGYAPEDGRMLQPDVVPFRCLHCGCDVHTQRRVLLNTALFTFLGWDEVDAGARVVVCAGCGHCAWFVHAMPGALQAMADRDDPRWAVLGEGDAPCTVCSFRQSVEGSARLNTRGLTLLGLEWLNQGARTKACLRCGHVRWSRRGTRPWGGSVDAVSDACRACGGGDVAQRPVLLNTRLATHLGFDWLNEGARLRECPCGALDWFVRPRAPSALPAAPSK